MANLTQTAADVGVVDSATRVATVQAGEAITQGQPVYLLSNKYYRADASTAAEAAATGIAISPAATDGYFLVASSGKVDVGATLTVGETYYVSDTAGAIMPSADVSVGEYVTILGIATAAGELELNINASGVARA